MTLLSAKAFFRGIAVNRNFQLHLISSSRLSKDRATLKFSSHALHFRHVRASFLPEAFFSASNQQGEARALGTSLVLGKRFPIWCKNLTLHLNFKNNIMPVIKNVFSFHIVMNINSPAIFAVLKNIVIRFRLGC